MWSVQGGGRFIEFLKIQKRYGTFNFGFAKSRPIQGMGRSVEVVIVGGFIVVMFCVKSVKNTCLELLPIT